MVDNTIIHELLKEVRDDQRDSNEKSQEFRIETLKHHSDTNNKLEAYNKQLEIHIDGVNTLKSMHKVNVDRIEKLERFPNFIKYGLKIMTAISLIIGVVIGVSQLYMYYNK